MNKSTWPLVTLTLTLAAALYAQSITGDLVVNVVDPSSAAVSGAKLTLTQANTNVQLTGETDTLGHYLFPQLKPGPYTLDVSASGFRKANVTDIVIAIGQRAQVEVNLTLGAVTETVTVSGTAETLLSENASVGQV